MTKTPYERGKYDGFWGNTHAETSEPYTNGYTKGTNIKAYINKRAMQSLTKPTGTLCPHSQGESMKTRNRNRGYEIAARLVDNYEGKQDMDSNTWNDLVVRLGDAINQAKVGAGIRRIAEAEGVIETEETE